MNCRVTVANMWANIRGKIVDARYDLDLCAANVNVPIVPTLQPWPIRSTLAANL
jgi:hypothetical protein